MSQVEPIEVIRLPCGHVIPRPAGTIQVTCIHDSRTYNVWWKGSELLAREVK